VRPFENFLSHHDKKEDKNDIAYIPQEKLKQKLHEKPLNRPFLYLW
jgi:hypothetical protein